jgi:hypothetical protein
MENSNSSTDLISGGEETGTTVMSEWWILTSKLVSIPLKFSDLKDVVMDQMTWNIQSKDHLTKMT